MLRFEHATDTHKGLQGRVMPAKGHRLSDTGSRAHHCGDAGGVGQNGPCKRTTAPGKRCYAHGGDGADMLNEELILRIEGAVRTIGFLDLAARGNGMSPDTVRDWMKRGEEDPEGPYGDFYRRIDRARAQNEIDALTIVTRVANGFEKTKTRTRVDPNGNETIEQTVDTSLDSKAAMQFLRVANPKRYKPNLGSMAGGRGTADDERTVKIIEIQHHYSDEEQGEDEE